MYIKSFVEPPSCGGKLCVTYRPLGKAIPPSAS
jgi:hypothetical protein